jgi:branched-chain amino acid transport system substrate-binding protein
VRKGPAYRLVALVSFLALGCQGAATPTTAPAPGGQAPAAVSPAAQATGAPGPAGAVTEVLIGEVLPLTGNFANMGQQYQWAAQTAADVVNSKYPDIKVPLASDEGLPKVGGAKIRLVIRDDQSRGELARTVSEQQITVDKVAWLDGDGISGNTSVIQPVAESHGIPLSCHACTSPSLTDKGLKWFWRTGPNDQTMIGNVFTFFQEWPQHGGPADLKTMAVFSCDNLFCQDGRKLVLDLAPKTGFQLPTDITTKTGATTFSSEVQQLQASNPDVLFIIQYPPETTVFQADAKRAGWMPKVVMTSNGAYSDELWLQAQKKTNGGVGWLGRDPTSTDLAAKNPSWRKVNEIYKTYSNGQNMGELAMREFTGVIWIADTINRAGSTDPAALQKAANETNTPADQLIISYKGIKFNANGQNELGGGVVTQVGWDGEKHTVWPWDLAQQAGFELIFPSPSWQERDSKPKPAS